MTSVAPVFPQFMLFAGVVCIVAKFVSTVGILILGRHRWTASRLSRPLWWTSTLSPIAGISALATGHYLKGEHEIAFYFIAFLLLLSPIIALQIWRMPDELRAKR